jgi:tRNA pseudouridine38-40 synthase
MNPSSDTNTRGQTPRIVLFLEYDGARFSGSQVQRNGVRTVQGAVETALESLTGQSLRVRMASRTDAGAHARKQVASFEMVAEIPLRTYESALNYHLPDDVSVTEAFLSNDLDVNRDAISRSYRYTILNKRNPSALLRNRVALVRDSLDATAMSEAATVLDGWMDVRPFTGPLAAEKNPLRRFDHSTVERDDDLVSIDLEASGFLPRQIRRTSAALIRVGTGSMSIDDFNHLALRGEPGAAIWSLPASGLCLMNVTYPDFHLRSDTGG